MPHRVTFVVSPGFELLDLSGPLCVFNSAMAYHSAPYKVRIVSATGGMVESCARLSVKTIDDQHAKHSDTVIVVGGPEAPAHQPPRTVSLLRSLAAGTQRMASVCTGTFYLARAGLLDGHRVTTHWRFAALLQSRFPRLMVDADRIYINDRAIWTSAGITAGIDMALALVEADCGQELAKSIARDLLVYYRRPGGQSQFSTILNLEPGSRRIRDALAYARENLQENLSVERLAEAACISIRQLGRIFLKETGETPARAIERMRVEVARPAIEDGSKPLELIALEAGFGDPERMRRSFLRLLGQSPRRLRRIARSHSA